ncbi:MAG: enoyl-CoA hydratase/isomerase family protein, partial [Chloroflexi bacterium]|nr:enoyl-CoA hydratase/isomerase family protein [Chloroflexota bacterium]
MAEKDVLVSVSEGIATVTINRPHAMNAMTTHVTATIISSLQGLAQRDDVRVVVIRGAGDRAFCAGHDLKELAERSARGLGGDTERTAGSVIAIATFPKPTIAAVRGFVRGGGNWLATSCDMVVAAED